MFRKVKKKSGLRRKRPESGDYPDNKIENDNDDDDDDNDVDFVTHAIRQTQKKHKILASLPLASGSAGSASGVDCGGGHKESKTLGKQQSQPSLTSSSDKTELSILASKHQQNMEEYISKHIQAITPQIKNNKNDIVDHGHDKNDDMDDNNTPSQRQNSADDEEEEEEDLYQQLSRETYRGGVSTLMASHQQQYRQDDDQGAGGAMLVGSGIAEVILPAPIRLSSATTTTANDNMVRNKHNISSSSSAIPKGTKEVLPLTTPKPIGRSMVQQQALSQVHANSTHNASSNNNNNNNDDSSKAAPTNTPDSKRAGFDAIIRGRPTHPSNGGAESIHAGQSSTSTTFQKKKNRDDQAFANFINKQYDSGHRRF
jgi:hypothetical protein